MAAGDPIVDVSDLINLSTGGGSGSPEQINFLVKPTIAGAATTAPVQGRLTSLWKYDASPCAATSTPTTAVVTTNATDGSLKQTTSATSAKKRLLSIVATTLSGCAGTLILYDRLGQHGGHSGTTTSAQSTNLPTAALTRYTTGVGVEAWIEIYSAIGATPTTVTLSYTDEAGNTGNTSPAFAIGGTGLSEVNRLISMPLAAGDKGVRAVANTDLLASTGTAGNYGVTLAYPLIVLPMVITASARLWSGIMQAGGPLNLGATSDACLALAFNPNTTTQVELLGSAYFIEK